MKLTTIKEYAASRGLAHGMIRRLICKGEIPAGKVGHTWFLDAEKVDNYFDSITAIQKPQNKKSAAGRTFDMEAAIEAARARSKAVC